jgi:hypothetical protein
VRVHRIFGLLRRVRGPNAAGFDLGKPGTGEDFGVALAARFVVTPEQRPPRAITPALPAPNSGERWSRVVRSASLAITAAPAL